MRGRRSVWPSEPLAITMGLNDISQVPSLLELPDGMLLSSGSLSNVCEALGSIPSNASPQLWIPGGNKITLWVEDSSLFVMTYCILPFNIYFQASVMDQMPEDTG